MHDEMAVQDAPTNVTEVIERLDAVTDRLPKRLKQCASFTRQHLHLIAVSKVSEMAEACGVAPSAYMRFCQALGFSGYTEMQSLFRARVTDFRPAYNERLANLRETGAMGTGRLLADFSEAGHKSLIGLASSVTNEGLDRIAQSMADARVVHLVGLRRAFSVVSSMAYIFDQLGVPAQLHFGAGMLNAGRAIFPGDVLFAVTYAPFSEETVALAKSIAVRGIPVFCLTDSEKCPVADCASELLIAREDEVGGFRSLNASLTLTTALAVAVRALREPG
ncbi:MAG: MurR/RpiR family transcriptional regulator [Pseudomonadota bacterium]